MLWRTLGRLLLLPIAFVLAAVAAATVLVTLGLEHITHAVHGRGDGAEAIAAMIDLVWQGSLLASGLSIIPALAVVIVGEVARIRSWLYYMVGGGIALASMPLIARVSQSEAFVLPQATVWQVCATAGFAGGLVYWLLAGRNT